MKNIQKFLSDREVSQLLISRLELSQPTVCIAHADIAFNLKNNEAVSINTELHAVYFSDEEKPKININSLLDIQALSSKDSAIVRKAILTYLYDIEIKLVQSLFFEDYLTDDEIEAVNEILPNTLSYLAEVEDFDDMPFNAVSSLDTTSNTALGFVAELMYQVTDHLLANLIYNIIKKYFNDQADFADFTEYASELIKNRKF